MEVTVKQFAEAYGAPESVVEQIKIEVEIEQNRPIKKRFPEGYIYEFHSELIGNKLAEQGYYLQRGWILDDIKAPHPTKMNKERKVSTRLQVDLPISLSNVTSKEVADAIEACADMSIEELDRIPVIRERKVMRAFTVPVSTADKLEKFVKYRAKTKFIAVALSRSN